MKKLFTLFLTLSFASILVLAGCSSTNSKVATGVSKMMDTSNQLAKAIDANDQAKAKNIGPKLEDQWSSFEDDVKKDHKDLYNKVEKYLDPTVAGTQAGTFDKNALGELNHNLSNVLKELKSKLK